jgi:hypothetical protein
MVLHAYHLPCGVTCTALHRTPTATGIVIHTARGPLAATLLRFLTPGLLVASDIERLVDCFAQLHG